MGDVVDSGIVTRLQIPPEKVLLAAIDRGLDQVVVLGFTKDTGDDYFASSEGDAGNVLYHLARAYWQLMKLTDEIIEGRE